VWLILAWALWLGLGALARRLFSRRGPSRVRPARRRARAPRGPLLAPVALSVACLAGVVAVGDAVARTAQPDSHVYEYAPIRQAAAAIARAIPPHRTVEYRLGPLDLGTQPMETAIRFLLVRRGDRVLANDSLPRLGSYYELYRRPVQWTLLLLDGTRAQAHMTLAARVRFRSPWGPEVLSAWAAPAARARDVQNWMQQRPDSDRRPRRNL
jgi:hypothetical protein